MWNFHRVLKQAGFEHAQTSADQHVSQLGEFKKMGLSQEQIKRLENDFIQGRVWRVHRYRLNKWSENVETLKEHQKVEKVNHAFDELKRKYPDRPEIQNSIYIRNLNPRENKAALHEFIVFEREPGFFERVSRWIAIGKWS